MREAPNAPRRTAVIERAINSSAAADSQLRRARLDGRHGPGERHRQNFTLLKIVDGLAKLPADVFRKGANRGPRRRMEDRRLHSFNVSYLGHRVKEARASAENNGLLGDFAGGFFEEFVDEGL